MEALERFSVVHGYSSISANRAVKTSIFCCSSLCFARSFYYRRRGLANEAFVGQLSLGAGQLLPGLVQLFPQPPLFF